MASKKYTFIDLFAGCGGLSEGFYREGFKALAHVEINHFACETLRTQMYAVVPFEIIELDSSNLHSSKKSFTPKTRYDAQFEELNNLQ